MAIDVLLTGTVVSKVEDYMQNSARRVRVTLEARDAYGERVNVTCSTSNERLAGSLGVLEMGQSACVRGHAMVPFNPKRSDKLPRISVYVTDVIIL